MNANAPGLTDEEREVFEQLSERYEDDPLGDVFEGVLQSDEEIREVSS